MSWMPDPMGHAERAHNVDELLRSMESVFLDILAEVEGDRDSVTDDPTAAKGPEGGMVTVSFSVDRVIFDDLLAAWIELQANVNPRAFAYLARFLLNPMMRSLAVRAAEKGWMNTE